MERRELVVSPVPAYAAKQVAFKPNTKQEASKPEILTNTQDLRRYDTIVLDANTVSRSEEELTNLLASLPTEASKQVLVPGLEDATLKSIVEAQGAEAIFSGERKAAFTRGWNAQWKDTNFPHYGTKKEESNFSNYSSKGWKLHIAFEKGKEKGVSEKLYQKGLHFKTKAGMGTWFHGNEESGSTIYVGSHNDMQQIAAYISEEFSDILKLGAYADLGNGEKIPIGSGSDIKIAPGITGRFDVAKSQYSTKYGEQGVPTWFNSQGIPLLVEDDKMCNELIDKYFAASNHQEEQKYLNEVMSMQERAKQELIKDFGAKYVTGQNVGFRVKNSK